MNTFKSTFIINFMAKLYWRSVPARNSDRASWGSCQHLTWPDLQVHNHVTLLSLFILLIAIQVDPAASLAHWQQKPVHAHNESNLLTKEFSIWVNLGVLPTFTLPLASTLWRGLVDQRVLKIPMIWSDLFIPEGLKVSYFAHLSSSLTVAIKDLWVTVFSNSFTTRLSSSSHQGSRLYLLGAQYHIQ